MPSTLVHLALAALLGAALLRDAYGPRALGVLLAVTIFVDLDTFVGIVLPGTHRAAFHTLVIPLLATVALYWDTRIRDASTVKRYGENAVRVAWVTVAVYVFAAIGPDLFTNGVNLFYPLYDRFITISGYVAISDQRGLLQTLWQPAESVGGTTADTHYYTGVDPTRGSDRNVERVFPIATNGRQVLLIMIAIGVTGVRLWEARTDEAASPARR